MRISSHAAVTRRRELRQFRNEFAILIEELLRLVASHPGFKDLEMFGIFPDRCEGHLVRTEGAFDWNSIHFLRTGPSLGCAQDDHGPDRLFLESALARLLLNGSNLGIAFVQRSSQDLMDDLRIVAFDKIGLVTPPYIQGLQVFVARPCLNRRSGDFVAVEVQNRKDCAVPDRLEEVDRLPASFERASLGFSVTDHAGNDQIGIVESGAEGVNQRVAKLAALMHGIRDVRSAMAGHAAWRRELPKELSLIHISE